MNRLRPALAATILALAVGAGVVVAAPSDPCPSWQDPAGDAGPASGLVPVGDKDLDITRAEVASSDAVFLARVSVVKLGATGPNASTGTSDQFTVRIKVDGVDGELTAKRDTTNGVRQVYAQVGSSLVEATADYNLERNTVTIAVTPANMAMAAGKPIAQAAIVINRALSAAGSRDFGLVSYDDADAPAGTTLQGFCTSSAPAPTAGSTGSPAAPSGSPSASATPTSSPSATSTATSTAKMSVSAPTRIAFSDSLPVQSLLTDSQGRAAAGKTVTLEFTGAKTSRRTGSDGRARAALAALKPAGVHAASARWAGDAQLRPAAASRRVEVIRERVAVRVAPGTEDGRHVATITVRDDDGALVRGGGVVTVFIDGTRRGTVRLDSSGRANWPAPVGSSVTVDFPGAAGTYLPARGSRRV